MKSRVLASIALGAVAVLGVTGCSMISPQATTIQYSASDGVNIPNSSGPVLVRNAMIVANEDGSAGNFIAALVNDTDDDHILRLTIDGVTHEIEVPARGTLTLGARGEDPLLIDNLDSAPGTGIDTVFQSGDATGVTQSVPVIGGQLPYYEEFVPTDDAD